MTNLPRIPRTNAMRIHFNIVLPGFWPNTQQVGSTRDVTLALKPADMLSRLSLWNACLSRRFLIIKLRKAIYIKQSKMNRLRLARAFIIESRWVIRRASCRRNGLLYVVVIVSFDVWACFHSAHFVICVGLPENNDGRYDSGLDIWKIFPSKLFVGVVEMCVEWIALTGVPHFVWISSYKVQQLK